MAMTYAQWYDAVLALRAVAMQRFGLAAADVQPTRMPDGPYTGEPAARYSNRAYTDLANARLLDTTAPQSPSRDGQFMYVVAPQSAWAGAPHTMTTGEAAQNALFAAMDRAGVGGLLADLERALGRAGMVLMLAIGAYVVVRVMQVRGRRA